MTTQNKIPSFAAFLALAVCSFGSVLVFCGMILVLPGGELWPILRTMLIFILGGAAYHRIARYSANKDAARRK